MEGMQDSQIGGSQRCAGPGILRPEPRLLSLPGNGDPTTPTLDAFLCEQAGGAATDGIRPILDLVPETLHQNTPLVFGAASEVETFARYAARDEYSPNRKEAKPWLGSL